MENELRLTEKELLDKCRLFENTNGEIVITSLQMSKDFGIPHFKIMDNYRKWLNKGTNTLQVLVYKDGKGQERPYYELNKYQFMKYCMHTNKNIQLKEQIIDEYEAMEQFIINSNLTEEFKFYRSTGKELTKELQYYVVNYSNYCNKGEFLKKCINALYMNIFDKKAWQLYEERNVVQGKLRDSFTSEELRKIKKAEQIVISTIVYGYLNSRKGYEVLEKVLDIMKEITII